MNSTSTVKAHDALPLRVYLVIGAALLILTGLTVAIAQIDLGAWNLVTAMVIAGFKASLVALYFMHLKYDHKIYALVFVLAVFMLVVFIIFTMFDTMRRGDFDEITAGTIRQHAVIYDDEGNLIPLAERGGPSAANEPKESFEILHGFGPIKEEIEIGPLNTDLATVGQDIFEDKCINCHALDDPEIGPPLRDVTSLRSPTFIMNQILDPAQNAENHPEIQALRAKYDTLMTVENVTMDDARALLEYLRFEAQQTSEE